MTAIALTRRALRGKGAFVMTAIAAVVIFAVPAAARHRRRRPTWASSRSRRRVRPRRPCTRVTFSEVVRNNGPDPVEMDTFPQIRGGVLVNEVCQAVSPDTPFCEYGEVAAGTSLTAKFVVKVTATHGSLTVKGGVVSESAFQDNNPFDQFRSASVKIS